MVTREELLALGVKAGPILGEIFKATKNCSSKEEALSIAISIRDGTWKKPERQNKIIDTNSVLHWLLSFKFCPSTQQEFPASLTERRRMLDQCAVTINGQKLRADDIMPLDLNEIVFFKGSKRQTTIW